MIGVDERWFTGWLAGASELGGDYVYRERRASVGATDDGQKICTLYAKEQCVDGGFSPLWICTGSVVLKLHPHVRAREEWQGRDEGERRRGSKGGREAPKRKRWLGHGVEEQRSG